MSFRQLFFHTRRTWVLRFWGAPFGYRRGKASRRVIAWPVAKSDNATMEREGRAPRRKIQVWREYSSGCWMRALPALLLLVWGAAAQALPNDQKQPIQIEADGVEIDDGRQVSIYTGSVDILQGSMHLQADRVTVYHQKSRQPRRIVAEGRPARFRQLAKKGGKEIKARAMRIEYDANNEEVVLIDKAVLTQGKDSFRSDRILYDRHKAVVKAGAAVAGSGNKKGKRVRITIDPGSR